MVAACWLLVAGNPFCIQCYCIVLRSTSNSHNSIARVQQLFTFFFEDFFLAFNTDAPRRFSLLLLFFMNFSSFFHWFNFFFAFISKFFFCDCRNRNEKRKNLKLKKARKRRFFTCGIFSFLQKAFTWAASSATVVVSSLPVCAAAHNCSIPRSIHSLSYCQTHWPAFWCVTASDANIEIYD